MQGLRQELLHLDLGRVSLNFKPTLNRDLLLHLIGLRLTSMII